jgi:hypothetical protein
MELERTLFSYHLDFTVKSGGFTYYVYPSITIDCDYKARRQRRLARDGA